MKITQHIASISEGSTGFLVFVIILIVTVGLIILRHNRTP